MFWFHNPTRLTRRKIRRTTRASATRLLARIESLEDRRVPAGFIAVGTDVGVPAQVRIFTDTDANATYETVAPAGLTQPIVFAPYPNFTGGVRVAMGDFDGDGNAELVTAAGPGGGPHVIVWSLNPDGSIGGVIDSFMAYDQNFKGGVFVATGDVDGDGRAELVTAPDTGGGAHVKIFSDTDHDGKLSDNLVDQFFPFANFTGGVRLALGNTNNTGGDEVIVAAGPGGGPHVMVFTDSDADRAVSDQPVVEQFMAYSPAFTGGVFVASGAIDGAGSAGAEIVTAPGKTGGPDVRIYTDSNSNGLVSDNALFDEFLAYDAAFTGGVRVAVGDTDNSGFLAEVITGTGPGGGPHTKIYDDTGDPGALVSDNAPTDQFFAFPAGYTAGEFLAFGKVTAGTYAYPGQAQSIPDLSTLNSTFTVPAGAGKIVDLDISMNIFHSFDGDLDVTLTHVSTGTTVALFNDVGASNEGFLIRLDDEAGTDINTASNPKPDGAISGRFNPGGAALLSAFDGEDASGEWRLSITDDSASDTGALFGWSLNVTY
jgi:subtilisin-like proprotein convertase family protein